ncbi:thioredoxin fold domain-containing protein [Mucilaginibacter rubeus]|uniref:LysE family transporter n=1 Tax=Mucilaginibacter rubeus TaxID=2027860 RepID=A0AAE6JKQ2_9SPHI|nr:MULTISPECIES: thioredoxin family protein [Mucilaginibacter]QEM07707.1 thioredoxin fold domain-containing protein [Mucilaginibacter rubeus]QEM20159.1 thioredoxin fold domain-containing protein [Mucilaginibacter gossypii]QTE43127.1 LysE family transporter [Mucilaginibacter rubeus]QTE49727.1 LysE family transporter [Mucilaginibacter rubeus]QTE54820.1 LysE family transporter [Mucilaginibacter rubeus]
MTKQLKLFWVAFSISFVGALPIGTLNTNIANFALNNDIAGAAWFAFAAILVEVVIVRIGLVMFDHLVRLKKLFKILSIVFCIAILMLAYKTLWAAFHMHNFRDVLPFAEINPFYSGLLLSLLNPLHLPFWMGWTAFLKKRKVLSNETRDYNIFIIAIGTGTLLSFIIYGVVGNYLMNILKAQHNLINWILGLTLLLTGLVQAYKLIAAQMQLIRNQMKKSAQILLVFLATSVIGLASCTPRYKPRLSSQQGINFKTISLADAQALAKAENKPLFVFAHASWCPTCKQMEQEVLIKQELGKAYNPSLVNVAIDIDSGDGKKLKEQYPIRATPTLFFFNADGSLAKKLEGFTTADFLLAEKGTLTKQ